MKLSTSTIGFHRMGPKRELKFALEKYWKNQIELQDLKTVNNTITDQAWALQRSAQVDRITVGDNYYYDVILTWAESLGIVSSRHRPLQAGVDRMFAMARGIDGVTALSMKKWLTSNYHYMVPEYDGKGLAGNFTDFLDEVKRGVSSLGASCATPVVVGPVTMAYLTVMKSFTPGLSDTILRQALLREMLPIYTKLLAAIAELGVTEIQIHEAALVIDDPALLDLFKIAYPSILQSSVKLPAINMVSFMDDVGKDNYLWLCSVKELHTLSLDFTRGDNLKLLQAHGFPEGKVLGIGMVDSRNVWAVQPDFAQSIFGAINAIIPDKTRLRIQTSASLQFVPWTLACETDILKSDVGKVLAFAVEKLNELQLLSRALLDANDTEMESLAGAWRIYKNTITANSVVSDRISALTSKDFERAEPFQTRRTKQLPGLTLLPTTTIGSFPQTTEIRKLRNLYIKGSITKEAYESAIDQQIALCIGIQEGLGLDILVHGEPERTDMVEFFGQKMDGMLFTTNGWVQSFGSRCVRPPIIWADVHRKVPMTVREYKVAQALTSKPVKGMLTGPVTILNWSFPRIDITRKIQAMQLALCIRDEISDLEQAGCEVIQVDEPALREAMPLKTPKKQEYMDWAVDAFRLSTAAAEVSTQVHTHMCYCEFEDCMDAIDKMDTDVISIENARSDDSTLKAFKSIGYTKGFGPGTYDIHSPVVPPVTFIDEKLRTFLDSLDIKQLVVNPDCGLKTRTWPESIAGLQNMVVATKKIRLELGIVPVEETTARSATRCPTC